MIHATIEIRKGVLTRRVRVTAPSVERALKIAGAARPDRTVRLLSRQDPEAQDRQEAA